MKKEFLFVAACFIGSPLLAQDSTYKSLDNVIITAAKFPQKQSTTGKVVSVITQQQLQRSEGKDLSQVLNEQTGINVNGANSNPGKDKTIFLRGASSNYTLILLDGIPLIDPSLTGGTFDIRLIPLGEIERIEILKGSQSTLYGSSAIAGVINIITKKSGIKKIQGDALAAYGSYNSFKGAVNISGSGKILDYNIGYEYYTTAGISEAKDTTGKMGFDKDGFRMHSFQGKLGINVSDALKITPYFRYTDFKGDYDDGPFADAPNKYTSTLLNTGLVGSYRYTAGTVSMNYGCDYVQRFYNGAPYKGQFQHAEAYVNHDINKVVQFLAGLNYQYYRMPPSDTSNNLTSAYASVFVKTKDGFNAELGGRYNHHNKYGNNFTYSFNPSYLIQGEIKVFANFSSGFRAPSISELFGPFGANPNLKPEKSANIEAGIESWNKSKTVSFLVTAFHRDIKDVIAYDFVLGYLNRDKQKDQGIETEINLQANKKLNVRASYAYVKGEITQSISGKDTTFNNLIRRPKHSVNLYGGYQFNDRFFANINFQFFSKRRDIFYNPATYYTPEQKILGSYALLNVYGEYGLYMNKLKLFLDVKNLLDNQNYYEAYGFNVQGINVTGGLRFKF